MGNHDLLRRVVSMGTNVLSIVSKANAKYSVNLVFLPPTFCFGGGQVLELLV